ncbi:hypothetical protein vBEcoMWL3_gp119 [Escherichia phage vB_EcoM_WL-3]|nr:hypothetical protein vBEcoMWL3_gp119 [Escherichia phage vB_EcoM_WL-3]
MTHCKRTIIDVVHFNSFSFPLKKIAAVFWIQLEEYFSKFCFRW